ncbi:hypothetical protein [Brachybacterium sp. GPGPB12]|uniref:hypothetical protein n=1 Tax=Brachybacterium sp. GPGPB12 TaxID=3023517 RepID=UPI00313438C5
MPEANADAIWDSTLSILRRDDTVSQRVMALLTLSRLMAVVADTALLAVPSTSAKELIENRIAGSLKAALSEAASTDLRFAVTVDESLLAGGGRRGRGPCTAADLLLRTPKCTSCGQRCGQFHGGCPHPALPSWTRHRAPVRVRLRPARAPSSKTSDSAASAASHFGRGEDEFHGSAADDPSAYAGMSALSGASAPSPGPAPRRPAPPAARPSARTPA